MPMTRKEIRQYRESIFKMKFGELVAFSVEQKNALVANTEYCNAQRKRLDECDGEIDRLRKKIIEMDQNNSMLTQDNAARALMEDTLRSELHHATVSLAGQRNSYDRLDNAFKSVIEKISACAAAMTGRDVVIGYALKFIVEHALSLEDNHARNPIKT